jgi:outer membrane protein assembly factor BamB
MKQDSDEDSETIYEEVLAPSTPNIIATSGGPMDSAWPIAYHDARHTGRSLYSTANNSYDEKWRFYSSGWLHDTPVIDSDGTIYVGAFDWNLFAVNPDGTLKWKFKTSNGLIWGSSPAIAEDGTIYIGSWDGGLYAINSDGSQKWRFGSGAQVASSPVIDDDGTIYFGIMGPGDKGRIYAVNPNGTEKWHYDTGYWVTSDPCIGDDGTVYIGSGDTYFYAMKPDGTLKWRFKTGDIIQGHPSIANDGTVYIGSFDGNLYALNPNGTQIWKYGAGTETNPSIASDGTIYIGYRKLYAINPNGTSKWSFNPGADKRIVSSSPAISADGTIYVGTNIGETSGGEIIAVNPDGTERWRKRIATEWVDSSPSIGEDGTVYIGSSNDISKGYLHAFNNVDSSNPPGIPTISGPSNIKVGEDEWYTFISHDPDNNPIQLFVDWDDGDSGWVDWFASGEKMWAEHKWDSKGSYTIKAKVRDEFSGESDWGYFEIEVSNPRSKASLDSVWYRFLDMFPILKEVFLRLIR